ncbi:hypothetical protein CSA80_03710 [Candidatus Saccharibacteria bacterium]|nr:MAG: hypothetical protein CR973_01200 [Candidatus Saccharibacteria bacterium]PID99192.1 MAG: hypothetical protein CSA80_03710 [Candidatus Saccharibacteria bacterium]
MAAHKTRVLNFFYVLMLLVGLSFFVYPGSAHAAPMSPGVCRYVDAQGITQEKPCSQVDASSVTFEPGKKYELVIDANNVISATLLDRATGSFPNILRGYANTAPGQCPPNWKHLKEGTPEEDVRVCCPPGSEGSSSSCLFAKYINPTVKILALIAGIATVIGIVAGGLQYSASGGDPQKTAAGKARVVKALYGLIAFLFLYSALQFFSPGGISSKVTTVKGGSGAAKQCSKTFLGLKPWFYYLPDSAFRAPNGSLSCDIYHFSLFGDKDNGKDSDIVPILLVIADDLIRISGLVAVAFVITGGIRLSVSQGEPEKTKAARQTIINALIGLVIAIVAASVVSFVGGRLSS